MKSGVGVGTFNGQVQLASAGIYVAVTENIHWLPATLVVGELVSPPTDFLGPSRATRLASLLCFCGHLWDSYLVLFLGSKSHDHLAPTRLGPKTGPLTLS